jgi:hypothetical protein
MTEPSYFNFDCSKFALFCTVKPDTNTDKVPVLIPKLPIFTHEGTDLKVGSTLLTLV